MTTSTKIMKMFDPYSELLTNHWCLSDICIKDVNLIDFLKRWAVICCFEMNAEELVVSQEALSSGIHSELETIFWQSFPPPFSTHTGFRAFLQSHWLHLFSAVYFHSELETIEFFGKWPGYFLIWLKYVFVYLQRYWKPKGSLLLFEINARKQDTQCQLETEREVMFPVHTSQFCIFLLFWCLWFGLLGIF